MSAIRPYAVFLLLVKSDDLNRVLAKRADSEVALLASCVLLAEGMGFAGSICEVLLVYVDEVVRALLGFEDIHSASYRRYRFMAFDHQSAGNSGNAPSPCARAKQDRIVVSPIENSW